MLQATASPEMKTGMAAMDELHHGLFETMAGLSRRADKQFSAGYDALVTQAEHAFATEEQWMEEIDFPELKSHREQHAHVLSALHHVRSQIMDGELGIGRDVTDRLLPQWFALHISTMDTELGMSLQTENAHRIHAGSAPLSAYAG